MHASVAVHTVFFEFGFLQPEFRKITLGTPGSPSHRPHPLPCMRTGGSSPSHCPFPPGPPPPPGAPPPPPPCMADGSGGPIDPTPYQPPYRLNWYSGSIQNAGQAPLRSGVLIRAAMRRVGKVSFHWKNRLPWVVRLVGWLDGWMDGGCQCTTKTWDVQVVDGGHPSDCELPPASA